jgi:hypothetical protein
MSTVSSSGGVDVRKQTAVYANPVTSNNNMNRSSSRCTQTPQKRNIISVRKKQGHNGNKEEKQQIG